MQTFTIVCLSLSLVWATPHLNTSKKEFLKNIGSRIINGEKAAEGQFPWQVALRFTGSGSSGWFCGGTIIGEEWILTAGHCVDGGGSAIATVGAVSLSDEEAFSAESSELILHEGYDPETVQNDIGLVRLSQPLTFNGNVQAIRLSEVPLSDDTEVTVSGWGLTSDNGLFISDVLNYVHLRTISNAKCQDLFKNDQIFETMVCATSNEPDEIKSPCNGDSGGPVVTESGDEPELVAVVSFVSDNGCEAGDPSGYVRVASYLDWIREKVGNL